MYKMVLLLLCVFTVSAFANEPVLVRDLQIAYDQVLLEEELQRVADYYIPRHQDHDNWTAIPLRNASGTTAREGVILGHTLQNKAMLPCKDSPFLDDLPYIRSILDDIAARFDAEIGLVRLSKVPSFKAIEAHRDGPMFDIHKGSIYRLHIPIITGENVDFIVAGNVYHFMPGFYFTNVSELHAVINNGPFDRIHLIIDVQANPRLQEYILVLAELEPIRDL